jgi:hypothetical protein
MRSNYPILPGSKLQKTTLSWEREREREIRSLIIQVFMVISCSKSRFQQEWQHSHLIMSVFHLWHLKKILWPNSS